MPAIGSLTLADGQVSPVNHTYAPVSTTGSKATWAERVATGQAFWPMLTNEVVFPTSKDQKSSKPITVRVTFYYPVGVTENGVTSLDHFSSVTTNFYFAPTSSEAERKDIVALYLNNMSNSTVKTSISSLEPFY